MNESRGFPALRQPGAVTKSTRPSHADVTERLLLEFEQVYGLRLVSEVLRGCRAGVLGSAEAFEVLARGQLAGLGVPSAAVAS